MLDFFFSSRRRHTRFDCDWSSDVCSSDLAFSKTLKDRKRPVKILYQHDTHQPIGVPISLKETDVGLEIEGKISQTPFGQEVLTLCRDGVLDGLSIGFDPIKWEMEQEEGKDTIRRVKEVLLYEVSIVTF